MRNATMFQRPCAQTQALQNTSSTHAGNFLQQGSGTLFLWVLVCLMAPPVFACTIPDAPSF